MELLRSIIDHKKVFVLALNGPAVGGGGAWFTGVADIVLASDKTYFQIPFSALGLVSENGSAFTLAQSMGVHRANEFLMFGTKLSAAELERQGVVNQIFPNEGFHDHVKRYLEGQLKDKDGKSMMEVKRLQNASFRDQRIVAVFNSIDALAERFVDGAPFERFKLKAQELEGMCSFSQGDFGLVTDPRQLSRKRELPKCDPLQLEEILLWVTGTGIRTSCI